MAATAGRSSLLRFVVQALVVVGLLLLLGYWPTQRLGGDGAVRAMFAGCAIGLAASLIGMVPVLLARGLSSPATVPAAMTAIGIRLAAAIMIGIGVAASGLVAPKPLLVWVVISHAGLLVPDTRLTIEVLARRVPAEES